jgi:siroheme synthase-like protein
MSRHAVFPISLYVRGRRAVVVGDGAPAERRAEQLRDAGADVCRCGAGGYDAAACAGAFVVMIEAGGDDALARRAGADARAAGALVYVADRPALSDFAMPAIATRGPLKLAVSTDGVAPALTRRLREELQRVVDEAGGVVDELVAELEKRRDELSGPERARELYAIASRLRFAGSIEER